MARDITIRVNADDATRQGFDSVKRSADQMAERFDRATDKMVEDARDSAEEISDSFEGISSGIAGAGAFGPFGAIVKGAQVAVRTILGIFSALGSLVGRVLSTGFSVLKGVWDGLVAAARAAFDLILGAAKAVVGAIGTAFEALTGIVGKVFSKVGALVAGGTAFAGFKLAELGAQYEQLESRGQSLARSVGQDFAAIRRAVERGTQGALSDLDLMRQTNNALILSVAKTPEEFETLAATALGLSQAVGIDVRLAFESLVTGIGRQSRLMLDNVGIIVKAEEAYERYAATLGKATSDLTDEEQKEAFRLAALEEGRIALERAGGAAATTGTRLQTLTASFKNLASDLGLLLLPAADDLLRIIQPIIDRVREWGEANRQVFAEGFQVALDLAVRGLEAAGEQLQRLLGFVQGSLPTALEFLGDVGSRALDAVALGVELTRREFGILRDAVVGFFNGEGFDASGSAIVAAFDVIAAEAKVLGIRLGQAIFEFAGPELIRLGDLVSEFILEPLTGIGAKVARGVNEAIRLGAGPIIAPLLDLDENAISRFAAGSDAAQAALQQRRITPRQQRLFDLQAGQRDALGGAQSEAAAARAALGDIVSSLQGDASARRDQFGEGFAELRQRFEEARQLLQAEVQTSIENVRAQKETADEIARNSEQQAALNQEVVATQEALAAEQRAQRRSLEDARARVQAILSSFPQNTIYEAAAVGRAR